MNPFVYKNGALHAEDVAVADIASAVGTPFYCYSTAGLVQRYTDFANAFSHNRATICYAVKANGNLAVIRTLAALGAGADVVSEGELRRALAAGTPTDRIVFSGVGKSRAELAYALTQGIVQINVESEPELEALSETCVALDKTASIGVRVNPDVDAQTHAKISTGKAENKFGIDITRAPAVFARARDLPGVNPVSVAVHIGSQITDLTPLRIAFGHLASLVDRLRADGHNITRLDLGGGLGIRYEDETPPTPAEYAAMVNETLGHLDCHLMFEPGRVLVGEAGILVTSVLYDKPGESRRFVIVDAAMNDLVRPSMYDAYHGVLPIRETSSDIMLSDADIVGPVCETGDTFARHRAMPPVDPGDMLAILSAGAYGAVMSSTYNARLLIPEVLVNGDAFAVVRARPSYDELLKLDQFADWQ
ncbi:MAG: diaminopimelate decarboxylase [Alphaproteobacteria bacterium]|nr:diaminopimelate decarboxylase [Alphaproteobacteria bacterium]